MDTCLNCGNRKSRKIYKYCSNRCQQDYQYKDYVRLWKKGFVNGNRGIVTKNISKYVKKYLLNTYGEKCSICLWDQKHPLTQRVPLEIDHKNGNSDDNSENNLRLVCPNCHSLSLNFRNLNKGRGRAWRLNYLKKNSIKYN